MNKGKKTQAEESAKVKKKLNKEFSNPMIVGRTTRSSTIGGGESIETDNTLIGNLVNYKSDDDLNKVLLNTPAITIPTINLPISPLSAGGYLSFGNTQINSGITPPPPSSPSSSSSSLASTPVDIKRGRSASTSSGTSSSSKSNKSKSPLLFGSSEQPSSGFFGLFGSPKLTPTTTSPLINLSISPSIISQDITNVSLQKQISEGFMNEFYEKDKDPKALEKGKDELQTWSNVLIPNDSALARKELKFIIRRGIPDVKRVRVWKTILGYHSSLASSVVNPNFFREALSSAYGDSKIPKKIRNIPTFGGVISPSDHYLTDEGTEGLKQVLSLLALNYPDIEYCPVIPDIVNILLLFMSKETTYSILTILIEHSNDPFYKYLNTSNTYCTAFLLTFDTLIENHIPKLYKYMINLGMKSSKPFSEEWFSRLFVSSIPYPTVLRIFDIFLCEGYKVVYRVGLALLMIHKKTLMKCTSTEKFLGTLRNLNIQLVDSDQLIKKAFSIHLKRNQLNSIDAKQTVKLYHVPEPSIPIYYKPKVLTPSDIIEDEEVYEIIWAWLPHRLCICDPKVIFNSKRDGFNLRILFEKCKNQQSVLVLIKSDNKSVFGFFIGEELKPRDKHYFGSSETFLFTLQPHVFVYKSVNYNNLHNGTGNESGISDTPTNDLYINVGNDYIKVGSSEFGDAGIYLDSDLKGNTNPTITFNNPILNSEKDDFTSVIVEVLAFE